MPPKYFTSDADEELPDTTSPVAAGKESIVVILVVPTVVPPEEVAVEVPVLPLQDTKLSINNDSVRIDGKILDSCFCMALSLPLTTNLTSIETMLNTA
ncbi:hypothetical protein BVY03_05785 [bacterium K02(2017)]|nr:hypothetical protein BVY03_05785 [bacterium K02(2017)]